MTLAVYFPNIVRGLAIFLTGYCMLGVPVVVHRRSRFDAIGGTFAMGVDLLLLGRVMQSLERWHQPLVWWGAPLTLVAMVLLASSAWLVLRQ